MIVRLFQKKGVLHGILGILFIIYPFIWGLIHFKEEDIKKPMTLWLAAIGVGILLAILNMVFTGSGSESSFLSLFI
jgi:hypothetical protein